MTSNQTLQPTRWPAHCLANRDFKTLIASQARFRQQWLILFSLDGKHAATPETAICYRPVFTFRLSDAIHFRS